MSTARAEPHDLDDDLDAGGVILSPEQEAELAQVIVETDEDERMGRVFTAEEVLAGLRRR